MVLTKDYLNINIYILFKNIAKQYGYVLIDDYYSITDPDNEQSVIAYHFKAIDENNNICELGFDIVNKNRFELWQRKGFEDENELWWVIDEIDIKERELI